MSIIAHLINHTHWDREWFLTAIYTSRWIPGLIDKLAELVDSNPDFHFFLDGQTLIIEDLLQVAPHYQAKVERLVRQGNLLIGPYYCQPDWRLTGGESLVRNLLQGAQDMRRFQGKTDAGWLVDTFGHISQEPQLHRLFGIDSVYVWRGAPRMEPFFQWQGADQTALFTVNVFGGYRNLYAVIRVPEMAIQRLQSEIEKLRPYYPTGDIPLFDGYDLEDNPEDPWRFFQDRLDEIPAGIQLREATPPGFAQQVRQKLDPLPVLSGELNSGKYGAVFPGTLSARTYLKVMARDCEHLLYQVCEPLAALVRLMGRPYSPERYAAWARTLLQNAVHDCICGVSIDQVHERMEVSYRQAFDAMQADLRASLAALLQGFAPGSYAVSTTPYPYEGWQVIGDRLHPVRTQGVGVWKIGNGEEIQRPAESVARFGWQNAHYTAHLHPDGTVRLGSAVLGSLVVYEERGDAYSDESGPLLGRLQPAGPFQVEERSELHCVLRADYAGEWGPRKVRATVRLTFDPSPLIRWQIELDSRGANFRVEMVFETAQAGTIWAGMPFDVVQRPAADRDLLPRQLDGRLEAVLLGQRELEAVRTFPFHDFVALSDGTTSAVVMAKGLHSYQADEQGCLKITLRRALEWLTRPDLESRVGDAGPFFYVPDARCERTVTHELAFAFVGGAIDDPALHALNAGFQNPPLVVACSSSGRRTEWPFFQENMPLSSLQVVEDRILARVFNPTSRPQPLSQAYVQTDVFGKDEATVRVVPAKSILTLAMRELPERVEDTASIPIDLVSAPTWRVGENQGLPDPAIIQQLNAKIEKLARRVEQANEQLAAARGQERYRMQHQIYVLERELLEYRLSARLNEIKLGIQGQLTTEYLYEPDEQVAAIGLQLNQLRIKRRIYDYIVQIGDEDH